jgi:hypothetical protein
MVASRVAPFGLVLLLAACGGGSDDGAAGGSGAGNGQGSSAPVPGPSADGWQSDFADQGSKCSNGEDGFAGLAHVTVGSSTLYVGFEQVSGNNQDPIVARFDDGEQVYCRYHEQEGPDGRAVGITWDGGETAYVVYTIVGGGSGLEGKGGWLESYAPGAISGGGPKVSYVGRIAAASGELESGTFVIAVRDMNRKVNTHNPKGAVTVLQDGSVEFLGESAHKPISTDGKTAMDCTDYPFDSRYRFSADLGSVLCADSTNCVSTAPCE